MPSLLLLLLLLLVVVATTHVVTGASVSGAAAMADEAPVRVTLSSSSACAADDASASASASSACAASATIGVYRYGEYRRRGGTSETSLVQFAYVPEHTTYADLLDEARRRFGDEQLTHFRTRDGVRVRRLQQPVRAFADVGGAYEQFLVAMRPSQGAFEERWIMPAVRVGERFPVRLTSFERYDDEHGAGAVAGDANERGEVPLADEVWLETLSVHPRIFRIDDFLSQRDIDGLLAFAAARKWEESSIGFGAGDQPKRDRQRVSQTTWVQGDDEATTIAIRRLRGRTAELLQQPTPLMEPTQFTRYNGDDGGHYHHHYDHTAEERYGDMAYYNAGGNRLSTLIVYLHSPEVGGGTSFPGVKRPRAFRSPHVPTRHAGENLVHKEYRQLCNPDYEHAFVVQPRNGTAVLFYNLLEESHMDGKGDHTTFHAGCDVDLPGDRKVIINQWQRNKLINNRLY